MSEPMLPNNLLDNAQPDALTDEFTLLMSLALDDLLDDGERQRFDALLIHYPSLGDLWAEWQFVDRRLNSVPRMEPVWGFVQRFEVRLGDMEQRQQQRVLAFSLVAVVLVAAMAVSAWISTGAFVLATQGPWIGEQIRNAAYFSVALVSWFDALSDTLAGLVNSPFAQNLGVAYTVVALLMISGWVLLLRRSAHLADATAMPGLE